MSEPFVFTIPVRFADTDAQGHMYFANYLTFCDEAFAAYMRHINYPWQSLIAEGVDMFYVASKCDYRGSAKFEMLLHIEVRTARIGTSSVTTAYTVRAPDGATLAEVELTSVCVDPHTRKPVPVPQRFRDAVERSASAI